MRSATELEAHLDKAAKRAEELRRSNPRQAAALCASALEEAEKVRNGSRVLNTQVGRVRLLLSSIHILLANYDHALENAFRALDIFQQIELPSGAARSLNAIGLANMYLDSHAKALESLLQALAAAKELEDDRLKASVLNNLGRLYLQMEDYVTALGYLEQSLEIVSQDDQLEIEGSLLDHFCSAYLNLGKFNRALEYSQRSVELHRQHKDPFGEAAALNKTGEIHAAMGQNEQARSYFQQALQICETAGFAQCAAQAYFLVGQLDFSEGRFDAAGQHLVQALKHAENSQDRKQIYRTHLLLSRTSQKLNDYQAALDHFHRYHQIKEAVFSEDQATRIKGLEILHRLRETQQDREIYRLENVELSQEIEKRSQVQAELERMLTMDPLTSLRNRSNFFETAQKELDRSQRYKRPLSIIMLDIDHFKQVNDLFGHLVGDRVIVEVARRINKGLRRVDIACRYGGEEFAILLPETNATQAEMVANRLWREITRQPTVSSELRISITVSVGVASYESEGMISVDSLLDRADQALYAAKQNGRNQVAVYSQELTQKKPG